MRYDPASNVVSREYFGPTGGPSRSTNSTAGNVLLARSEVFFDELSRAFRSDVDLFLAAGTDISRVVTLDDSDSIPGDGKVTGFIDYDRNSRPVFITAPSPANALEIARIQYDGFQRPIRRIDAEGNEVLTEFDDESNPVRITNIDKNPAGRIGEEVFTSLTVFDSLNRPIRATDNIGQTRYIGYDSRDLIVRSADAQGTEIADPLGQFSGTINDEGNIVAMLHDGLGRLLTTTQELRIAGQGSGSIDLSNPSNSDGKIIEQTVWDKNSRVVSVADDKQNTTLYGHDTLNRLISTTFADGTSRNVEYDRDNNPVRFIDNNGTIVHNTFDAINRLIRKDIQRSIAHNIKGTTLVESEYDGLSRLTRATDNNDPNDFSDDSVVERRHDSLSRLLEEVQNGKVVSNNWREDDDKAACIYPNGRKIDYTRDKLDRLKTIGENGIADSIASYDYIGYRVLERVYGNSTRLTMLDDSGTVDTGYDALPRLVGMRHLDASGSLIAGYGYGYNRENFKLHKDNLHLPGLSESYKLDSVYRVVDFQRGTLDINKQVTGTPVQSQSWQLDGVDNWDNTVVDGEAKVQTVNNMNEYESFGSETLAHDDNGNLTDDGERLLFYDYADRLVEVRSKEDDSLIGAYKYDFMNRRISKFFTRGSEGEFQPDANTLALYHFNEVSGPIVDSSGNGNHGKPPRRNIVRGVEGLFGTNAVELFNEPIKVKVKKSSSLNNITDQLTVEAFVFLTGRGRIGDDDDDDDDDDRDDEDDEEDDDGKHLKGSIVDRSGSFRLEVTRKLGRHLFAFTLHTKKGRNNGRRGDDDDDDDDDDDESVRKAKVYSDIEAPLNEWVHVAAVYDGNKVILFINGTRQADEQAISGNVRLSGSKLHLGGRSFEGRIEEARISSVARTDFGGGREDVLRRYSYCGWRVCEESEQTAPQGEPLGAERVTRQFVDGRGIDEHLTVDLYDGDGTFIETTLWYYENHRGDTIALADSAGNVVGRFEYSTYGEIFAVNVQGNLVEFKGFASVIFGFHGRRIDEETGLMYFRNRHYSIKFGRFIQRDAMGYKDSMGLYSAFGGNAYSVVDPYGLEGLFEVEHRILNKLQEEERRRKQLEREISLLPTGSDVFVFITHAHREFDPEGVAEAGIVNITNYLRGKVPSIIQIEYPVLNLKTREQIPYVSYAPKDPSDKIILTTTGGLFRHLLNVKPAKKYKELLKTYANKHGLVSPTNTYVTLGGYTFRCQHLTIVDLAAIGIVGNENVKDVKIVLPASASYHESGETYFDFLRSDLPEAKLNLENFLRENVQSVLKIQLEMDVEIVYYTTSSFIMGKITVKNPTETTPTVYIKIVD